MKTFICFSLMLISAQKSHAFGGSIHTSNNFHNIDYYYGATEVHVAWGSVPGHAEVKATISFKRVPSRNGVPKPILAENLIFNSLEDVLASRDISESVKTEIKKTFLPRYLVFKSELKLIEENIKTAQIKDKLSDSKARAILKDKIQSPIKRLVDGVPNVKLSFEL